MNSLLTAMKIFIYYTQFLLINSIIILFLLIPEQKSLFPYQIIQIINISFINSHNPTNFWPINLLIIALLNSVYSLGFIFIN